jgi:hypothetical protein
MVMACNDTFVMRVLKCTMNMHILCVCVRACVSIVELLRNGKSLSTNLFVITRDLKVVI